MNAQFHTPSFGDEVFAVTEIDSTTGNFEHQFHQSKRMRGSMDNSSLDEYHTTNEDDAFTVSRSPTLVASPAATATATVATRKQLLPAATADPNEPPKPLSAYALFFRDTVSAIKQQNPNCSFQEISRIVSSMWEALDPMHKNVYNKKNEMAKNEYIRQMRSYRQQQQQQLEQQQLLQMNTAALMQAKPQLVYTISRPSAEHDADSSVHLTASQQLQQQPQQMHVQYQSMQQQQQVHYQQQLELQHQPSAQQGFNSQQQPQQLQQTICEANTMLGNNCAAANSPPAQQIQLLTEAGSVQKCIREHCTKRAIINPDWEDEYCSNECVVIHCRNVFNAWVQSNMEARTQ